MREACRQTKQWLDAGIAPPSIAVNLSGLQFKTALELESTIAAILAETGVPPRFLELELTESVLMDASRQHNDVLIRLRQMGLRIAIDDFGTGYSSLDYLRRFPVDRIKIAQVFITDLGAPENTAIVRAAIGLARALSIEVIAEGVETVEQLALLKEWGCLYVQGYYFAKPLPVPEATALLRVGKIAPRHAVAARSLGGSGPGGAGGLDHHQLGQVLGGDVADAGAAGGRRRRRCAGPGAAAARRRCRGTHSPAPSARRAS